MKFFFVWVCVVVCCSKVLIPHSMNNDIRVSASKQLMSEEVVAFVTQVSKERIASNDSFVVALSGGSLPGTLLSLLKDDAVEWKKWKVLSLCPASSLLDVVRCSLLMKGMLHWITRTRTSRVVESC